ncbi:MFS transporter [Desulfosediminicola ganghwensis]|uniref:MFS transporter n=1 Tax=Desulfosediminicola ganghwensis TaxID=2569540 RepID=UPI0010AC48E7|nr:MFS transporter [Desulfosediminicola ganghwensis]
MNDTRQKNHNLILLIICIVQFITPFMAAGVNVALPAIGEYYQASTFQLSLAAMLYILGLGCLLLPSGQLSDLYGRKKIFLSGIIGFCCTSIIITFSPDITIFLILRFIQGMATALITTASFAILSSVIPPEKRGRSMGIIIAFVYAGLSAGPALGGFLVDYFNWQFLFWFTAAFGIVGLCLSIAVLRGEWWGDRTQRFDFTGSLLFALVISCLTVSITGKEWVGDWATLLMISGVIGAGLFIIIERRVSSPVLPVNFLLSNRSLSLSALAALLNYAASFGIIFFFSLYLQSIKGLSPQNAGLLLMIQTLIQCILSPSAGKLADRIYPGKLATVGMGLCALSLFMATRIEANSSLSFIIIVFIIMGLGFALFSSPNTTLIMNSVPKERYGMASSLTAIMRNLGMLVSMAISTFLVEHFMGHSLLRADTHEPFMNSMQWGMACFAGISCLGVLCSVGRFKKPAGKM